MNYLVIRVGGYLTTIPESVSMTGDSIAFSGTREQCLEFESKGNRQTIQTYGYHKTDNQLQPERSSI